MSPVGEVAAKVKDGKGLPTRVDGMKKLSMSDLFVICTTQENGEHVIAGCGEVHVGGCVKDLRDVADKAKDGKGLPTLVDGLKKLSMSDPLVICTTEENGEHVIAGCFELHVGRGVKDLRSRSR